MAEKVNVWFGGGYEIPYRLPFVNPIYSDITEPDPECLIPIQGMLITSMGTNKAKIYIDDKNWLGIIGCKNPFVIECSKLPKDGFLKADEYAWSSL